MPAVGRPSDAGAADRDAALGCGRHVDGRVARAAGDEQLEIGQGVDHVLARNGVRSRIRQTMSKS